MISKVLILVAVAIGCVAGSCTEVRKPCTSQYVTYESYPVARTFSNDNVLSGQQLFKPVQMVKENNFRDEWSKNYVLGTVENNNENANKNDGNINAFFGSGNGLNGNFDGPETSPLPVVLAPAVTLPTIESPMVTLAAPAVPAPRVLASRCVCTKTVVKPQIYQRVVTVPKVQRYLKRTVTPVVENLIYKSRPVNALNGNGNVLGVSSGVARSVLSSGSLVGNTFVSENAFSNRNGAFTGQTPVHSSSSFVVSGNCNSCKLS